MQIKAATTDEDIGRCSEVILELRPHLKGKDIAALYRTMLPEGFRVIYTEDGGEPAAFAGYRPLTMFFSGKTLYIDDLCTLPRYRGRGHAGALLDHIIKEAKDSGFDTVTLDSGHHRYDAHRLYLNKGFVIESHHFHMNLRKI